MAISIERVQNTLVNNNVVSTRYDARKLTGLFAGGLLVRDLRVHSLGAQGTGMFQLHNTTNVTLEGVSVYGTASGGFRLDSAYNTTIISCTVTGCSACGLQLTGTNDLLRVEYCDFRGNSEDGALYGPTNTFRFVGNYFDEFTSLLSYMWGTIKEYVAKISQLTNGAPTAIVLENTLGVVEFAYDDVGQYEINSSGLFTVGKTVVIMPPQFNDPDDLSSRFTVNLLQDNSTIPFTVGTGTDYNTGTATNNILKNLDLQILVYP